MAAGGCICGAVRFDATPQDHFRPCHRDICRRWPGDVYLGATVGDTLRPDDETELRRYASSQWLRRGFCSRCGTTSFRDAPFWDAPEFRKLRVAYNAFDEAPHGDFATEPYIDHKPDAYSFADATRKLTEAEVEAQFMDGAHG